MSPITILNAHQAAARRMLSAIDNRAVRGRGGFGISVAQDYWAKEFQRAERIYTKTDERLRSLLMALKEEA